MILSELPAVVDPTEWYVVFHVKSATRWLAVVTPGRFKHVSAFAYCAGVGMWLLYDVHWHGTRLRLLDKAGVMAWSRGCAVVSFSRRDEPLKLSGRLGHTCVTAVRHLLGLRCVAWTPTQLYRHILRNGGYPISEHRPAALASPDAGRPDAGPGAAARPV